MKSLSKYIFLIFLLSSCSNVSENSNSDDICVKRVSAFTASHVELVDKYIENGISKSTVDNPEGIIFLAETIEKWIVSRESIRNISHNISDHISFLIENPECDLDSNDFKFFQDEFIKDNQNLIGNQLAIDWLTMGWNTKLLEQYESQYKYEYEFISTMISTHIDNGNFEFTRVKDSTDLFGRFGYLDVLLQSKSVLNFDGLSLSDQQFAQENFDKGIIKSYEGGIVDSQGVMENTLKFRNLDEIENETFANKLSQFFNRDLPERKDKYRFEAISFYSIVSPSFTIFNDYIYSREIDSFNLDFSNYYISGEINGTIDGKVYKCNIFFEIKQPSEISQDILTISSDENREISVINVIPEIINLGIAGNFWAGKVCDESIVIAPTEGGYVGSGKKENNYLMLPIVFFINHIDSVIFNLH